MCGRVAAGIEEHAHLPLVFAGGAKEKVAAVREHLPDAGHDSIACVAAALKKAITSPPRDRVPRHMMESEPDRTAAQKPIREGSAVGTQDVLREFRCRRFLDATFVTQTGSR